MNLKKALQRLLFQASDPGSVQLFANHEFMNFATANEENAFKDDTVFSTYRVLEEVLIGSGWRLVGEDASIVPDAISGMLGSHLAVVLKGMVRASWMRYFLALQFWREEDGLWVPWRWLELPHSTVEIELDSSGEVRQVAVWGRNGRVVLKPLQYILYLHDPSADKPMGTSLYDWVKPLLDMKTKVEGSLTDQVQRFGSPPLVGRYRVGSPQSLQNELLNMLVKLKSSSVAVVPEGTGLEILEPKPGSAGTQLILDLVRLLERRVARAIMGAVLAIYESEFSSRATAESHQHVLQAIIASYQRRLADEVNHQILEPALALNGLRYDVRFELVPPRLEGRSNASRWIVDLTEAGYINPSEDGEWVREYFLR